MTSTTTTAPSHPDRKDYPMSILATLRTHTDTLDTATLLEGIALLDKPDTTPDERTVRAAMFQTLEARFPAVDPIMDAWADDLEATTTYAQALTAAIAQVTA